MWSISPKVYSSMFSLPTEIADKCLKFANGEQLKVIREELGEDTTGSDADLFMEKLKKLEALERQEGKSKLDDA